MNEVNLVTKRFKTCGYGKSDYDRDGHYDGVWCGYFNNRMEFCGDILCPLDGREAQDE